MYYAKTNIIQTAEIQSHVKYENEGANMSASICKIRYEAAISAR